MKRGASGIIDVWQNALDRLLKLEAPNDVEVDQVSHDQLPTDWLENTDVTCATGDAWLAKNRSPLLLVPSAVVPETYSILLNPVHPGADRIVIAQVSDHAIDPRLLLWPLANCTAPSYGKPRAW